MTNMQGSRRDGGNGRNGRSGRNGRNGRCLRPWSRAADPSTCTSAGRKSWTFLSVEEFENSEISNSSVTRRKERERETERERERERESEREGGREG